MANLKYILILLAFSVQATFADEMDDLEDIANESDAAVADTAEVKRQMGRERDAAARKYKAVAAKHKSAAAQRQRSVDAMNKVEADIEKFQAEEVRLNKEIESFGHDTVVAERDIQVHKQNLQKVKGQIVAIQQLKKETEAKFIQMSQARDKAALDLKEIEQQKLAQEAEFNRMKDEDKLQSDALEKNKMEVARERARLETYVAQMKERYRVAREKLAASKTEMAMAEQNNARLQAQAKAADQEVAIAEAQAEGRPLERESAAVSLAEQSADESGLVFKRKCKVYGGPTKKAGVVGMSEMGASVAKVDEGKKWIAYMLGDGRKGFVAKSCF